MRNKDTH